MQRLVTRESMMSLLKNDALRNRVIGRALVALLKRQTQDEAVSNVTRNLNYRGFAPADARQGSIAAKTFIKRGELLDFQEEFWMKPSKTGLPRIVKYVRQLNEVANEKLNVSN